MTVNRKFGIKEFALIFSAVNLILFLMYFVPYYVLEVKEINQVYEYMRAYVYEIFALWLLPISTAAVLSITVGNSGIKKILTSALLLSLPNLAYTVPFYYILGIEYGADSIESLGFLILVSVVYILIFFACITVLFYIIKQSVIFFTAKEFTKDLPEKYKSKPTKELWKDCLKKSHDVLPEKINQGRAFDLSSPASIAFFFAALAEFAIYFSKEVYNTVSYLINYQGGYQPAEIAYMIFRFIFILIMLFVSIAVSQAVKKRVKASDESITVSK